MARWAIGVAVVVVLAAAALVVRLAVTGDDTNESNLTAPVQKPDSSSPSSFKCPTEAGLAAVGIPTPEHLSNGVDIAFPALDIGTALAGVPEEYLFGESELELVAAAILCTHGGGDISSVGSRGEPGLLVAMARPAGVLVPEPWSAEAPIAAQADGGPQGGYNSETERWEVSGNSQASVEDSNPDANGARVGIDLQYAASAPKCWDDEGDVDAITRITGEVSRLNSDGDLTTVEVDVQLTVDVNDGSVSSETQIGAFRYTERDGQTTTDWDLPALLYDDDDAATLDAAARTVSAFGAVTAVAVYAAALEKAYEGDTLDNTSDCLEVILDPSELMLEPGASVGVIANIHDWKGRPIVVVVSAEAAQGTMDPDVGPTSSEGIWATTYTAPSGENESDRVVFTAQRQAHVARGYLQVGIEAGEAWSFSMTVDVEQVAFLWDGLFIVHGGGQVTGSGIGTVLGEGYCEVNDVSGPIANITGTFTFEVTGASEESTDAEFLTLDIDSTEAEIEFSYEDARCGAFVEIARDFLKLVPTFPSFLPGFEIQVSDGFGTANLPFDPYEFEVDVARLGE